MSINVLIIFLRPRHGYRKAEGHSQRRFFFWCLPVSQDSAPRDHKGLGSVSLKINNQPTNRKAIVFFFIVAFSPRLAHYERKCDASSI